MSEYSIPLHRRIQVFERDGYRCVYCAQPLTLDLVACQDDSGGYTVPSGYSRATVDHVIPRSQGGHHRIGNLVACCPKCNSRKGAKPAETYRGQIGQ